jgi:hypothetical protein
MRFITFRGVIYRKWEDKYYVQGLQRKRSPIGIYCVSTAATSCPLSTSSVLYSLIFSPKGEFSILNLLLSSSVQIKFSFFNGGYPPRFKCNTIRYKDKDLLLLPYIYLLVLYYFCRTIDYMVTYITLN